MSDRATEPVMKARQGESSNSERDRQDAKFEARVAIQDLQRPIERILECCRRLEEQCVGTNTDSQALLAEARKAAAEARRLVLRLQAAIAARSR